MLYQLERTTKVKVKAFKAVNHPNLCEKFFNGHIEVLKFYGVTQITTASNDWFFNPNVYVILIESFDEIALGGVRIHLAHSNYPLPLEFATCDIDPSVHKFVENLALEGTGEVCGLWNAKEVAGMGIGTKYLMRAAISMVTTQIKIKTLLALCAEHTREICEEKGFEAILELGENGTFYYPKDDLVATAIILKDPSYLGKAILEERNYIISLRRNPIGVRLEETKKGLLELHYQLMLPHEGCPSTITSVSTIIR